MRIPAQKGSRGLVAAFAKTVRMPSQFMRLIILTGLSLLMLPCTATRIASQAPNAGNPLSPREQQALRAALNNGVLLLAASRPDAPYFAMANDIAAALGGAADVRVVPMATGGGAQNLRDLVYLRGVDLAIVPANVLANPKALEASLGGGLTQRVAYVAHLYAEEVHLVVGAGVGTVEGLQGKRIAVPLYDGTAEFTARDLLERLAIKAEIVRQSPAAALEQVRSGALAGVLFVGGKPLQLVAGLPKDGRLKLLGISLPVAVERALLPYLPAALRADDYPALIPPGITIETVGVGAVLMARSARVDEDAAQRVAKFVPAFFDGIADLTRAGRGSKWLELNLATPLPGWNRVPAAEAWLRNAKERQRAVLQRGFEEFLRTTRQPGAPELTPAEREKLLDKFIDWTRQSVGTVEAPTRP